MIATTQRFSTPLAQMTVDARDVLAMAGVAPMTLIARHFAGEWNGQPDNAARNEEYLAAGDGMLMSIFEAGGEPVWVISHIGCGEDDYTTVLWTASHDVARIPSVTAVNVAPLRHPSASLVVRAAHAPP